MTYSRLRDGFNQVKEKADSINRALPGVAKVTTMMGTTVLAVDKAAGWLYNIPSGLNTPLGIAAATVISLNGTGVDNLVGRFFNMYARESSNNLSSPQTSPTSQRNPANPLSSNEIAHHSNYWSMGATTTSATNIGYKLLQLHCLQYWINTIMGGFLGEFNLSRLIARLSGQQFDSSCEENHSPDYAIALVLAASAYSSYASLVSYRKYNVAVIREYFIHNIHHGHWREIGVLSHLEAVIGNLVSLIGIIYNNDLTWTLIENDALCHVNLTPIPPLLISIQTWQSAWVNFVVTTSLTLPAVHKRNTNTLTRELDQLLNEVPEFSRWNWMIRLSHVLAGISAFINTFIATVSLPHTIHRRTAAEIAAEPWLPATREPWLIGIAVLLGIIAFRNQYAISYEAYIKELERRTRLNNAVNTTIPPDLKAPLLATLNGVDPTAATDSDDDELADQSPDRSPVSSAAVSPEPEENVNANNSARYIALPVEPPEENFRVSLQQAPRNSLLGMIKTTVFGGTAATKQTTPYLKSQSAQDITVDTRPLLGDNEEQAATPRRRSLCSIM